jgi:hypothetical protein
MLTQELATSRAEVAELKEKLAQSESKSAKEQALMEEKVRQQVDQALQVQLAAFTNDMTAKFAQMMTMQYPMSNNLARKRPAHQLQAGIDDKITHGYLDGEAKRYNNNTTPPKVLYSSEEDDRMATNGCTGFRPSYAIQCIDSH